MSTTQSSPPSASSRKQQQQIVLTTKLKPKKLLTHTNTDKECLDANAGPLRRAIYTIDTHNGFKFLNRTERTVCHGVAWLCFATVATYSFVFFKGLVDGFSAESAATTATQEATVRIFSE